MALKVNLGFGGFKACDWGTLETALQTYQQIATQYGLEKPNGAFMLEFDNSGALGGVTFNYRKNDLNEANLQTFNDQWQAIATQYGIVRNQTYVEYFET